MLLQANTCSNTSFTPKIRAFSILCSVLGSFLIYLGDHSVSEHEPSRHYFLHICSIPLGDVP